MESVPSLEVLGLHRPECEAGGHGWQGTVSPRLMGSATRDLFLASSVSAAAETWLVYH